MASAEPCASLHFAPNRHHASTSPLSFLQAGCPSCRPTNSVKALKAVYAKNFLSRAHDISISWFACPFGGSVRSTRVTSFLCPFALRAISVHFFLFCLLTYILMCSVHFRARTSHCGQILEANVGHRL